MRAIVDLERLLGVQVDVTTMEQVTSNWFRQELDELIETLQAAIGPSPDIDTAQD